MEQLEFKVNESGIRIDSFLSSQLQDISRSRLEQLIKNGNVKVNKATVAKSYRVRMNDLVEVVLPPLEDPLPQPCPMDLDIVFEDEHLLVVNKPKGLVVHPAPGHSGDTLVNGLLAHCKDSLSGINGEKRPGIVHRIDKDTSGLLVVAKNDLAHQGLSAQLGRMNESDGTVNASIGRSTKDRKKMAVGMKNSKRAITHYKVLNQYNGFAHLSCKLETGRTHQIRVHLSSIGHPVLGDEVYGRIINKIKLDFEGQCLHAKILGFIHPITKEHLYFESELPEYFKNVLTKLNNL